MSLYKTCGSVEFNKQYYIYNNNNMPVRDIKKLTVVYNSYYGETLSRMSVKKGDNNRIRIEKNDGQILSATFLLERRVELMFLKNMINHYNSLGVSVVHNIK